MTASLQLRPADTDRTEPMLVELTGHASRSDVVLLQEIATRYRPLVRQAFPTEEWDVFYGASDCREPIAFRKSVFTKVAGEVTVFGPAPAEPQKRCRLTHVHLRHRVVGVEFHVTNVDLVGGAHDATGPGPVMGLQEWDELIAQHRSVIETYVASGLPVVGGGAYHRRLRDQKPLGSEVAGRPVRYAVEPGSSDLLWVVDGEATRWRVRSRQVFPGRGAKDAARNGARAAHEVTFELTTRRTSKNRSLTTPAPDPFELTTFGDGTPMPVDRKTRAALEEAERLLGYRLTLVQGSDNAGGVQASSGTHDGGGVVDLLAWDWQRKVRVLRSIGFAAWHRPAVKGLWGEHIHAVMVDHGRLAPSAVQQVVAYRAGRDGLRSNLPDPFWRPDPIPVFHFPPTPSRASDHAAASAASAPVAPMGPAFPPRRTLDGIDSSHRESGATDLRLARHAGVRWLYLKATEGTGYIDPTYRERVAAARESGMPVGAYHFARPDEGNAVDEARHFLANADIRPGDMRPMLKLQSAEGLSTAELTRWTGTWVLVVTRQLATEGATGKPIIHTHLDLENGFGCLLWVARCSKDYSAPMIPRPWRRAAIWQHSDGKRGPITHVPGLGAVHVNAMHPEVPLSALRLRPAQRPDEAVTPSERAARAPTGRAVPDDRRDGLRKDLLSAAASLQAALDALHERPDR